MSSVGRKREGPWYVETQIDLSQASFSSHCILPVLFHWKTIPSEPIQVTRGVGRQCVCVHRAQGGLHSFAPPQVICQVSLAQISDVDKAVAAAKDAFENGLWGKISARDRGQLLYR